MRKITTRFLFLCVLLVCNFALAADSDSATDTATPTSLSDRADTNASYLMTGSGGTNAGGTSIQADEFSGAVTNSINIPVPPARGSITPQLNLNYNSYRKNPNSWVGYGWEFDFGSIERTPDSGTVDYINGTSFQARFSGQTETLELIEEENASVATSYGISLDPGVMAARYRSKIEGAFNIYLHLRDHSDPSDPKDSGWLVIDKSGTYYYFGSGSLSREDRFSCAINDESDPCDVQTWIAKWSLDRVLDPNGNELTIGYDIDKLPGKITYQDITIAFSKLSTSSNGIAYYPNYRQAILNKDWLATKLDEITIYQNGKRLQKIKLDYHVSEWNRFYYLSNITQYGQTDSEVLPTTSFEYYDQQDLAWSETSYDYSASTSTSYGDDDGYINAYTQLTDMNGDGLLDKVVGYYGTDQVNVFYNNGNDFEYITGRSDWIDPFGNESCEVGDKCFGKLNAYYFPEGVHYQWLFLIDINGDGLPDRVKVHEQPSSADNLFEIAFNTGAGWDSSTVFWANPYHLNPALADYLKDFLGLRVNEEFFMDMNGDGLVDLVAGLGNTHPLVRNGFDVYYNTGAGFQSDPTYWQDPIVVLDEHDSAVARYNGTDSAGIYATIRDFNGDGLPDRIMKTRIVQSSDHSTVIGNGIQIFLNRNGLEWAQPEDEDGDGYYTFNGTDYLAILDPAEDPYQGYINSQHDWLDINGDGYLDRIIGDEETGKFTIYYYQGMTADLNYSHLTDGYEIADPIQDDDENYPSKGYISKDHYKAGVEGYRRYGQDVYVMTIDINGDGYLDRVQVSPTKHGESSGSKTYKIYPMTVNPVTYSDSPAWNNQNVTQPVGALKSTDSGLGIQTVVEYIPSSWPQRWPVPNHRLLPFNLYLAHKIYSTDYTLDGTDTEIEATRNPGMRWMTYDYYGGNLFVRHAEKVNPSDPTDLTLSQEYFAQFNGFQTVTKEVFRSNSDSWDAYAADTIYYQALGDIHTVPASYETYFNQTAYDHYAFSGRPYLNKVYTAAQTRVREVSEYTIDVTDPNEKFECDGICYPRLTTLTKTVLEDGASVERVSQITMDYDDSGNIKETIHYDGFGNELMTERSSFYPETYFALGLQIRDRPEIQTKSQSGTVWRQKEFAYDTVGNPTDELYLESGTNYATVNRIFNSNGTIDHITDVHGVVTQYGYDADGLFPIVESVALPSGGSLSTTHEFNRYLGKPSYTENDAGIGKLVSYDDFGRPVAEFIQDSSGNRMTTKKYSYEFVKATFAEWNDITLIKTQTWEPKTDFPDTETHPMQIVYSDPSGYALQQCAYTERGDYRLVQSRLSNGGRLEEKTEPIFSNNCNFISTIASTSKIFRTEKDIEGRPVYQEVPEGDSASPVGTLYFSYSTNSLGQLVKTITDSNGNNRIETYDYYERLIAVKDPNGSEMQFEYNSVGDLLTTIADGVVLTTMTYDLLGRKQTMSDANLGTWAYTYDSHGRLETQTDAKGQAIKYFYDSMGRIEREEVHDASDNLESYVVRSYDTGDSSHDVVSGELFQVEEYDSAGTLVRKNRFGYDTLYRRMNQITQTISGLGDFEQEIVHDDRGLVESISYPGGETLYVSYNRLDGLKNLCSDAGCSGTGETYYSVDPDTAYNQYGSLLKEVYGNNVTQEYEYYPNSHRMYQYKIYKDETVYSQRTYEYDIYSNITKLGDPLSSKGSGSLDQVLYDSLNRLTSYKPHDSSTTQSLTYSDQGNILTNSPAFGSDVYEYGSSKPHAVTKIGSQVFEYDDNGNMTKDPDRTMTYNAKNQLVKVEMKNGMIVEYDYDYTGARVSKKTSREDSYHHQLASTTYYLGDSIEIRDDKLLLHIHAGNKKIATKSLGDIDEILGGTGSTFSHKGIDPNFRFSFLIPYLLWFFVLFTLVSFRPVSTSLPAWVYCSVFTKGYLLKFYRLYREYARGFQETIFQFRYQLAIKTLCVFLALLFAFQIPIHEAHAGDSGIVAGPVSDENYFYYVHGDHLGSSHILTEGKSEGGKHSGILYKRGDLLQRIEYSPFGQEKYVLNPNLQFEPGFTGQKYDIETGLYYYQSRYYNPKIARFIQADTVVPSATDLQSYNRYSYVRNNPLKYVDPSGHSFWSWFRKIAGAFFGALAAILVGIALAPLFPATGLLASIVAGALVGAASGAAGGLVGGAITGGLKGALQGAGMGFLLGFVSGGIAGAIGKIGAFAVLSSVGLGLNISSDGWKGVITFGASLLGAYIGGRAMGVNIFDFGKQSNYELSYKKPTEFSFDYRQDQVYLAENSANMNTGNIATDALTVTEQVLMSTSQNDLGLDFGHMGGQFSFEFNAVPPYVGSNRAAGFIGRAYGVALGAEVMLLGSELITAGMPMLTAGPAGIVAGSFLVVNGISIIGFGAALVSESVGYTNYFWE